MQTYQKLLLILCSLVMISPQLIADGVNISVGLRDSRGGGSNSLNSVGKTTDEGDWTSGPDKQPDFQVTHSYKITKGKNGTITLSVNLVFKKSGIKDNTYSKNISITKNGEKTFKPFEGITMTLVSSGFQETVEKSQKSP